MVQKLASYKVTVVFFLAALAVLAVLLGTVFLVSPDRLGPFAITLWFLALFGGLWGFLNGCVYTITLLMRGRAKARNSLHTSGILSGYMVSLLALNSLRQLDVKDIVLVSILVLLIGFYVRKL